MCVIVTAEAGSMPGNDQLTAMSAANPDGAGIAWHDGTRLRRYRNTDNDKVLGFVIANRAYLTDVPFLLHFRIATNGRVCTANTHPFAYHRDGDDGYMAHNGIATRYAHGPHASDSRNAIEAWQAGRDPLTDGTQGSFAAIDHTGVITWLAGREDIDAPTGVIAVSNTLWMLDAPTGPADQWEDGYETGYADGRDDAAYGMPDYIPRR